MCASSPVSSSLLQESREGHAGSPPSPGHHLNAVLRQPGGGRDLPDRLHIFQLIFGVLPGTTQRALLSETRAECNVTFGAYRFYMERLGNWNECTVALQRSPPEMIE